MSDQDLETSEMETDPLVDADQLRKKKTTYEEAIVQTGYGWFQYRLLALCGWALSSDAVEILSISFILPPATCDLNINNTDKGWINSAIFLGMMLGGYTWGTLADMKGRRAILLWSLSVNALGGLASSFAQSYWLFLLLRIISGIGVGGSMPVIFTYYTEFQPKDRRGAMISFLATFWMCGNILAAALAWAVIPQTFRIETDHFHYNSWRLYLAVCIIPSLTSVLFFIGMPESPKFLMENGQESEALEVLTRVHMLNKGRRSVETYQVQELEIHQNKAAVVIRQVPSLGSQIYQFFMSGRNLFRPPLTSVMIIMLIIFFTLSYGYYGLFMWFPELFSQIEKYGGSACSPGPMNASMNSSSIDPCTVDSTVYLEGFLTAISNLPGCILTILIIDKVGRKPLLASSMVISGLCVFFIWFLKTRTESVIMACVFSGVSVIGWTTLDVLCAELFPTNLRSTATGLLSAMSRIAAISGNLTFGGLVTTNCAIPMILIAVLLSGGGLTAIKLPNTVHRDLL